MNPLQAAYEAERTHWREIHGLRTGKIKGDRWTPTLKQSAAAMRVLRDFNLKLVEPLPFGHPNRHENRKSAA